MSSNVPTSSPIIISSIGAIITFIIYIVKLLNEENAASYKENILGKIIILSIGYLFMCSSMILYIIREPSKSLYMLLLLSCLSIGITYASLSITMASKL
jgi:hypothetical protein